MLAFIDKIVIPFLNSLYGAVGYVGRDGRHGDRVGDGAAALGADPPVRRVPRLRPDPDRAAHRQPWSFWIVVIVATIGNTLGSLDRVCIGAYGGRPFLERYGQYLLIRPHEIELADRFFAALRSGDRVRRPAAADRPHVHQLPGRRGADAARRRSSCTRRPARSSGRSLLVYAGTVLGAHWVDIRHALQPFDLADRGRGRGRWSSCSSGGGWGCPAGRAAPSHSARPATSASRSSGGRTRRKSR